MKGWCALPERMNSNDVVQALRRLYTNFLAHYMNKEHFLGISPGMTDSWDTRMFNCESPHHSGVLNYFSRRNTSALQMGAAALNTGPTTAGCLKPSLALVGRLVP